MSDHLPESFLLASTRKDSGSEWLAKDNPETNPVTIRPKTASHLAELFSWVPLPYCSPLGCPFQIKCLALSAHVSISSDNSFLSVRQEPCFGPWKGSPFLQHSCWQECGKYEMKVQAYRHPRGVCKVKWSMWENIKLEFISLIPLTV